MEKQATADYPSDEISFRLHQAAHRHQEAAEAAIGKMRETDEILRQRIQTLPDWVAGEVDKRLEKAVRTSGANVDLRQ